MKHVLAVACAYEVVAVWTGRVPTITSFCSRRWWRATAVVTALAVHFAMEAERKALP